MHQALIASRVDKRDGFTLNSTETDIYLNSERLRRLTDGEPPISEVLMVRTKGPWPGFTATMVLCR